MLVVILSKNTFYAKAFQALNNFKEKAIKVSPLFNLEYAKIAFKAKHFDVIEETLNKIPPSQRSSDWQIACVNLYLKRKEYEKASAIISKLPNDNEEKTFLRAQLEALIGNNEMAIALVESIPNWKSKKRELLFLSGFARNCQLMEKSLNYIRMIPNWQEDDDAAQSASRTFDKLGDYKAAIACIEKVKNCYEFPKLILNLAIGYFNSKNWEKGMEVLAYCPNGGTESKEAKEIIAHVYMNMGEPAKALNILEELQKIPALQDKGSIIDAIIQCKIYLETFSKQDLEAFPTVDYKSKLFIAMRLDDLGKYQEAVDAYLQIENENSSGASRSCFWL